MCFNLGGDKSATLILLVFAILNAITKNETNKEALLDFEYAPITYLGVEIRMKFLSVGFQTQ